MIILDTNVVSELMRVDPQPEVLEWLNLQVSSEVFVSAITEGEIRRGIAIIPTGRRQRSLAEAADRTFNEDFVRRILPFDSQAAKVYAVIFAARRAAGRPITEPDCQIAAIASSLGAAVATRDSGGFEGCGIEVINPWTAP